LVHAPSSLFCHNGPPGWTSRTSIPRLSCFRNTRRPALFFGIVRLTAEDTEVHSENQHNDSIRKPTPNQLHLVKSSPPLRAIHPLRSLASISSNSSRCSSAIFPGGTFGRRSKVSSPLISCSISVSCV